MRQYVNLIFSFLIRNIAEPVMVLQTNIDPEFINEGYLGNVSSDGIKVDKKSILIRGTSYAFIQNIRLLLKIDMFTRKHEKYQF